MKKKESYAFGKRIFLLGKDKEGNLRWLEEPTWDCGWYWGFGYVETYTNNRSPEHSKDIQEHRHLSSLFFNGPDDCYTNFKNFFIDTPLTNDEIYKLLELANTAYTLKDTAGLYHSGNSNITENPCAKLLKSEIQEGSINEVVLPAIFKEIEKILTGKDVVADYKIKK